MSARYNKNSKKENTIHRLSRRIDLQEKKIQGLEDEINYLVDRVSKFLVSKK